MNIVILDPSAETIFIMLELLKSAGYDQTGRMAHGIHVSEDTSRFAIPQASSLAGILEQIERFKPCRIITEHDFGLSNGCYDTNGGEVVKALALPRENVIGTSTAIEQIYCVAQFYNKDKLGHNVKVNGEFLRLVG